MISVVLLQTVETCLTCSGILLCWLKEFFRNLVTVGGERDAWEKFREIRESVIIAKLFRRDIFLI